ncbi:DUF6538 domain-containing protein [Methylobacterium sp. Leaf456]|uniref:DUF6538 domain-containing protein n=1 Tax=Methylobacterium sp. Leaf456 TaxID=1736382 RepID=UPI0009E83076|nr:DUF6538 domain-containing protein [Methylobacterium sp. Leaf456]
MALWFARMPYITRSRHGVWKYRRVIPEPLRALAGKREIVQSLNTKDEQEAEARSLRLHTEAEAWLKSLKSRQAPTTSLPHELSDTTGHTSVDDWFRGTAFLAATGLPLISYGSMDHIEEDIRDHIVRERFGIDISNPETRDEELARAPEARAVLGILKKPVPTLKEALAVYLRARKGELSGMPPIKRRKWELEKRRAIDYFVDAVGEEHTVATLRVDDVRTFEEFLRTKGLAPASIRKTFKLVRAIIEVSLREFDIQRRNPFERYTVADPTPNREKRLPLTADEISVFLILSVNIELGTIARLLVFTGARLDEICGLGWNDVRDLSGPKPFIEIRPQEFRGVKTHSSRRVVPLLPEAVAALNTYLQAARIAPGEAKGNIPVFPRYGRDNGSAAASAALSKAIRARGITDPKKTTHSVRHAVKQALRDCGCPKPISDYIQGHASPNVAESYGLGVALDTMTEWLSKATLKLATMPDRP